MDNGPFQTLHWLSKLLVRLVARQLMTYIYPTAIYFRIVIPVVSVIARVLSDIPTAFWRTLRLVEATVYDK